MSTGSRALEGRRITVTGAGGFLGPHVVEALAAEGAQVRALLGPPGVDAREPAHATCVARADICDGAALAELVAGADAVVHMAGPSSVAASFKDPAHFIRVHTEGTATALEACRTRGVPRFVYVSSAEVYGRPQATPVREDHPLSSRSPYGAAKTGAEKLVEAFARAYGLRSLILRPFSIYGPGAVPEALIPQLISMARSSGRVTVRDLKPVRDYCYVTDVARAVALACSVDSAELEILNVGTMTGASVEQVASLVLAELGRVGPVLEAQQRERPGKSEIYELIADNRRAREVLGWSPEVSLEEGLRRTLRAGGA